MNVFKFQENVLQCCIYLITSVGRFRISTRSDPVLVARHMSGVVNSEDNNGVLKGMWDIKGFKDGKHPMTWHGSSEILQEFYKDKKTVKYGQCWVFGGLLTTGN